MSERRERTSITAALPPSTRTVRLGVLTDLHLAAPGTPATRFNNVVRIDRSRQLLTEAVTRLAPEVDALVLLGDLSQSAEVADYRFLFDVLRRFEQPAYLIAGNHDLGDGGDALQRALGEGAARAPIVIGPAGAAGSPVRLASAPLLADDQGECTVDLATPLPAADAPLVWLAHFPVLSMQPAIEAGGWRYAGDVDNRAAVERHLRRFPGPVIALTGHLHVRAHACSGNVLQLAHAALAESPHDASVITITSTTGSDQLTVRRDCHPLVNSSADRPAVLDAPTTRFVWDGARWQCSLDEPISPHIDPHIDPSPRSTE